MATPQTLIQSIEAVPSENAWRALSLEDLEEQFVYPFLHLSEEEIGTVIQSLTPRAFDMWRKKLWTEQDIAEEDDGYNRSMDVMVALKRSLLMRLPVIEQREARSDLTQQLARISLILNPMLLTHALKANNEDEPAEASGDEGD